MRYKTLSHLAKIWYCQATFLFGMAQKTLSTDAKNNILKLELVIGQPERYNDVLVAGPVHGATQHVIYFGGDVQDYHMRMKSHNAKYCKWNLEDTASLLQKRFPSSAVFVIKPAEMYMQQISIFRNFLRFSDDGCPRFSNNFGGLIHLRKLYRNALKMALHMENNKIDRGWKSASQLMSFTEEEFIKISDSQDIRLTLIGFSKGCVVLNQLVYESQNSKSDPDTTAFLSKFSSVYWLDGGHNGGKRAWITEKDTLEHLVTFPWQLFVHITPYQYSDPSRRYIGREAAMFVAELQKLKADITEKRHFENEPRSIENHFKVLEAF